MEGLGNLRVGMNQPWEGIMLEIDQSDRVKPDQAKITAQLRYAEIKSRKEMETIDKDQMRATVHDVGTRHLTDIIKDLESEIGNRQAIFISGISTSTQYREFEVEKRGLGEKTVEKQQYVAGYVYCANLRIDLPIKEDEERDIVKRVYAYVMDKPLLKSADIVYRVSDDLKQSCEDALLIWAIEEANLRANQIATAMRNCEAEAVAFEMTQSRISRNSGRIGANMVQRAAKMASYEAASVSSTRDVSYLDDIFDPELVQDQTISTEFRIMYKFIT